MSYVVPFLILPLSLSSSLFSVLFSLTSSSSSSNTHLRACSYLQPVNLEIYLNELVEQLLKVGETQHNGEHTNLSGRGTSSVHCGGVHTARNRWPWIWWVGGWAGRKVEIPRKKKRKTGHVERINSTKTVKWRKGMKQQQHRRTKSMGW